MMTIGRLGYLKHNEQAPPAKQQHPQQAKIQKKAIKVGMATAITIRAIIQPSNPDCPCNMKVTHWLSVRGSTR